MPEYDAKDILHDGYVLEALLSYSVHEGNVPVIKINNFIKEVREGIEKTGIITQIHDEIPQFTHRIFAEYFAACWMNENKNRMRNESFFYSWSYWNPQLDQMRNLFNLIILQESKENDLHMAVVNIVRFLYRLIHLTHFVSNVYSFSIKSTDVFRDQADHAAELLTLVNGTLYVNTCKTKTLELTIAQLIELKVFQQKFNQNQLNGINQIAYSLAHFNPKQYN